MTEQDTIKVVVKLWASHRLGRFKEALLEYPEGTCVSEGASQLGITKKTLGVVLINGQRASLRRQLHDGDILTLFPLISGG
jgi:sulfur carrier protein